MSEPPLDLESFAAAVVKAASDWQEALDAMSYEEVFKTDPSGALRFQLGVRFAGAVTALHIAVGRHQAAELGRRA